MDVFLPEDLEAEKAVIGCAVLAPSKEAIRCFKRLHDVHFSDEYHGWIWGRLSWACLRAKVKWDDEDQSDLMRFLGRDGAMSGARRFGGTLVYDIYRFTRPVLWWNIHWYAARVSAAYRRRAGIAEAAVHLERLIKEAKEYGL